jgi:hypothetical protein
MAKQETEAPRIGRPRAIAAVLPKVTAKALGKRGFAIAAVITDWAEIMGPTLAADTVPRRIAFSRGGGGGTLHLSATGAIATELQHLEPQILERINGYFGFHAVTRLVIHHGLRPRPAPRPAAADPPAGRAAGLAEDRLAVVEDPALREALRRLGRAVLARATR